MTRRLNFAPTRKVDKRIERLDLVTVTEVAELHDVSRTRVQQLIDDGRLPAVQVGRQWIMRRAVAEALSVGSDGALSVDDAAVAAAE